MEILFYSAYDYATFVCGWCNEYSFLRERKEIIKNVHRSEQLKLLNILGSKSGKEGLVLALGHIHELSLSDNEMLHKSGLHSLELEYIWDFPNRLWGEKPETTKMNLVVSLALPSLMHQVGRVGFLNEESNEIFLSFGFPGLHTDLSAVGQIIARGFWYYVIKKNIPVDKSDVDVIHDLRLATLYCFCVTSSHITEVTTVEELREKSKRAYDMYKVIIGNPQSSWGNIIRVLAERYSVTVIE
ncbi:hypothetical protein [Alicyclobacillus sp. ALC3]|uniref:hypothetical protein n=1 Tax=Alicyclobacillus sp. ALC3 TaxID=2796143 RepID=UPI0023794AB3|nr:hypothetical protein [Alicyclobacillus sp. ALC3]WDL97936.1 hypothetical protein JC200_04260 [Alicyclobacillus sp. ALC3]